MIEAGLHFFLSAWSLIAMIIGAAGMLSVLYRWITNYAFGTSNGGNGEQRKIGWHVRRPMVFELAFFGLFFIAGLWLRTENWVASSLAEAISTIPIWAVVVFIVFVWFCITSLLSYFAGWHLLMRAYRKPEGTARTRQRLEWAVMGKDVSYKNVLRISAYEGGLGLERSRFFGPFTRPLMIPWEEVSSTVEGAESERIRLKFGDHEQATLVVPKQCWQAIEQSRRGL